MVVFATPEVIFYDQFKENRKKPHRFVENYLGTCAKCNLGKYAKVHKKLKKVI